MTQHLLDNPMWHTLATHHARFAMGDEHALRYQPEVAPFASVPAPVPENYAALAELLTPDELVYHLCDEPPLRTQLPR